MKAVRPWSRPGERYAGHRWPQEDGTTRGGRRGVAETSHVTATGRRAPYRAGAGAATDGAGWQALVARAERAFTAPGFVERELNPILELSEHLRRARGAVLSRVKRHTWRAHLERALAAAGQIGLAPTPQPPQPDQAARLLDWCTRSPDDAREALRALWGDVGLSPVEHIGLFLHTLPVGVSRDPDERLTLATLLLGAVDPTRYPTYDPRAIVEVDTALDRPPAAPRAESLAGDDDPGGSYRALLDTLDQVVAAAARRGLPLRHRLHAAAVLRCLARERATSAPPRELHEVLEAGEVREAQSLARLAESLLLDERGLAKIVRLIEDRGQCIFYGPPGTGKTYVARALARFLAGDEIGDEVGDEVGDQARVQLVQFHPSYAYEDFVEGYRPAAPAGRPASFALVDGPLKRIAARARHDPGRRFVLVIDELNRANVAKVFGELYYLLEYRDDAVQLQYSQTPFTLPRNLMVIATMNAADRSIALVDLALRRRFYFVPFFPDQPPVEGLLRRWLAAHTPAQLWLADAVDRANAMLVTRHDRHAAIGPSHFMRPDLSDEWIDLIWEHAVLPTIAEQFFGDDAAIDEFRLERLRQTPPRRRAEQPALRRVAERRAPYRAERRTRRDAPSGAG